MIHPFFSHRYPVEWKLHPRILVGSGREKGLRIETWVSFVFHKGRTLEDTVSC